MPSRPARLLCAGKELGLLQSRCAVLRHSGYDAKAVTLAEAEIVLRTEEYDVVIISAFLSDWEKGLIRSAAETTLILELWGITLPLELLGRLEVLLAGLNL